MIWSFNPQIETVEKRLFSAGNHYKKNKEVLNEKIK